MLPAVLAPCHWRTDSQVAIPGPGTFVWRIPSDGADEPDY